MRRAIAATLVIALSALTAPAYADVTPSPSPTSTLSPVQQYEVDLEKYREDFKTYKTARAEYDRQLNAIAMEFIKALERAARDAKVAGKGAGTKANLAAARAQAAAARDQAVAALGLPPVPPTPPQKPGKANKMKSPPSPRPEKKN
jgi:hypothetical protein